MPLTSFNNLLPDARVWFFPAPTVLNAQQAQQLAPLAEGFIANWKSHGTPVEGGFLLLENQVLVVAAKETPSGCSTDSLFAFVHEAELALQVRFNNSDLLVFRKAVGQPIFTVNFTEMRQAVADGLVLPDYLYLNRQMLTLANWGQNLWLTVENTWLRKYFTHVTI
jgi:hypothetical protein